MSVHRSGKALAQKTEYLLEWLTREAPSAPTPEEAVVESHEKKFDSLIDELHKEKKKVLLYKPRT